MPTLITTGSLNVMTKQLQMHLGMGVIINAKFMMVGVVGFLNQTLHLSIASILIFLKYYEY